LIETKQQLIDFSRVKN